LSGGGANNTPPSWSQDWAAQKGLYSQGILSDCRGMNWDYVGHHFNLYRPVPKFKQPFDNDIFPYQHTYVLPVYTMPKVHAALQPFLEPVDDTTAHYDDFQRAVSDVFLHISERVDVSGTIDYAAATLELKNTSPGFPYFLKTDSKICALNIFDELITDNYEKYMNEDPHLIPIWHVFPKKELISVSKNNKGGLRTIQAPPIDFLLACISTFSTQNDAFVSSRMFRVGDVIEYGGFTDFAQRRSGYHAYLEMDGEKFDRRLSMMVMNAVRAIRARLHTRPELVNSLYRNIICAYMMTGDGKIFYKEHGNPSGSYNTIIDNCIASLVILSYVLRRAYISFAGFMKNNQVDICGDDLLLSMIDDYHISFDEYYKYSLELGMKYELALENADIVGHTFYGKTVAVSDEFSRYVGYPNYDKLFAQLCYLPTKHTDCDEVLNGLFAHFWINPVVRNQFRRFVANFSMKQGYEFKLPSDKYMETLVLGM